MKRLKPVRFYKKKRNRNIVVPDHVRCVRKRDHGCMLGDLESKSKNKYTHNYQAESAVRFVAWIPGVKFYFFSFPQKKY